MRRPDLVRVLFLLAAASFVGGPARAGDAPTAESRVPRLAVLVVVDQLRADFLERFGARLAAYGNDAGFRRLAREGAVFSDCRHRQGGTFTAPGHATIGSGTYPCVHGIVGNEWIVRGRARSEYCVADADATVFGAPGAAGGERVSVKNFRADSLGDAMKFGLFPRPKVVGVSLKDRSAILTSGRRADAAFWVDPRAGGFVSSDRYPAWREGADAAEIRRAVEARLLGFNEGRLPTFSRPWTLDPRAGTAYGEAEDDDRVEEKDKDGRGGAFPHVSSRKEGSLDLAQIETTPAGHDLLVAFVDEMIPLGAEDPAHPRDALERRLALGAVEGETDLLCVSFSSTDIVGHRYGPESQEAADAFVRLDAALGRLLSLLDAKVGKGRWLLGLTADHGAAPIPEWSQRAGLGGGRLGTSAVKAACDAALGEGVYQDAAEGNVYFTPGSFTADGKVDPEARRRLEERAREALLVVPGVWRVYTRTQLLSGAVPDDGPGRGALLSFDPVRSGDVVLQLAPWWLFERGDAGPKTSHGTPWNYDQRVPLMLAGPGVVPGPRPERASVVDLVATFAALLHVTPPAGCEGRPLLEALDPAYRTASNPLR